MKLLLSLCLLVIAIGANAQSFTIAAEKMNVVYIGIENPLTIVADNASCKELIATTENGTIQKKDSCHFYFAPVREGRSFVTIQKKVKGKNVTIGSKEVRVKRIPDPRVTVANKTEGPISLALFKRQGGLNVGFENDDESGFGFSVVSFTIAFFYSPCGDHEEDIVGSRFTDQTMASIKRLKVGEKVIIERIKVKGPDNIVRNMNGLVYIMR